MFDFLWRSRPAQPAFESLNAEKKEARARYWTDGWTIEYAAVLFSIATLIGLIILLAVCDGRPIFDWHGITINTIVALLSTLSRGSLMIALAEAISQSKWILFTQNNRPLYDFELVDRASRSALGQLNVLRHGRVGIVSVGALAALLSIAFDPFAQQLVQSATSTEYIDNGSAQLPIAKRYDQGTMYGDPPSAKVCNGNYSVSNTILSAEADFGMQSAVLYGLGVPDMTSIVQQLPQTCPSGNCTWPSVDSLAVCSTCTDIHDQVAPYPTFIQQANFLQAGALFQANSTLFALPNGVYIENMNGSTYSNLASLMITYGTGNPAETVAFQDAETLIWATSILRAQPDSSSNTTTWPDLPIEATECAFYYCVNTYTSAVSNGLLTEHEQPANGTRNPQSWQPQSATPRLTAAQNASLSFEWCVSGVPRSDLELGAGFNVSQAAVNSLSVYMSGVFSADANLDHSDVSFGAHKTSGRFNGYFISTAPFDADHGSLQWTPPILQPLYHAPNLTASFAAIARSMTNSVRRDNAQVAGRNGVLRILVRVQWPWIIVPILVVLAGCVQLVVSVVVTRRIRAPVWKSSSLATMSRAAHGIAELLEPSATVGRMERVARAQEVDLFPVRHQVPLGEFGGRGGGYGVGNSEEGIDGDRDAKAGVREEVSDVSALTSMHDPSAVTLVPATVFDRGDYRGRDPRDRVVSGQSSGEQDDLIPAWMNRNRM